MRWHAYEIYRLPPHKMPEQYHGRYAPSPTGLLHVGGARTALVAWCAARAAGGRFTIRIEDLDTARTVPNMAEALLQDLAWIGLDWDAGPDCGGVDEPYLQSMRHGQYAAALDELHRQGRLFPCNRSRKELRTLASAPHGRTAPYPRHLRPVNVMPHWYEQSKAAIRFRTDDGIIRFEDMLCGPQAEDVATEVGDFVLKRKDGVYAYQLAVVVDDLLMGITEVVRGQDLLHSTARQLLLFDALAGKRPRFAHVPLVVTAGGEKLSKRDEACTVAALRACGVDPAMVVGYLAWSLGLATESIPMKPHELVSIFSWSRIQPLKPWRLPNGFPAQLSRDVTLQTCAAS